MRRLTVLLCCIAAVGAGPNADAAVRDDTAWLQAALDAGGTVSLPRLPNGECYRTRGLWVSRDGTTITSDGACLVALGLGEARFKNGQGQPIKADAVFLLNHSKLLDPLPVRVTIRGLRIAVPARVKMDGIAVFGHEVLLDDVTITGAPWRDVLIGGGRIGTAGMTVRVTVRNCHLSGARRDVLAVYGPVGLRIEGNTLSGGRVHKRENAAAGLHILAADRGQAVLDVQVTGNRILNNAGPGIFTELDPANGFPVLASRLEISGNQVLRNAAKARTARRAGIVLAGGQRDGKGTLLLARNVVSGNSGPGLLGRNLRLRITGDGNELGGNRGGPSRGFRVVAPAVRTFAEPWLPPLLLPFTTRRDDTAWLQARLDKGGGTVFLPRLPNDECYATRGLWVSHDDTTITSDGACIVSLGPGEVRLHSPDGDPIPSAAVFFVNRSGPKRPPPVGVTISNLRIVVPEGEPMYGVATYGHQVTLSHLDISGAPKDDVLIGSRANGNGYAGGVAVLDSVLSGAQRNAISATGVIGLRIERNTIQGVRDRPPGQPAAGIDIEPDSRSEPAFEVTIAGNTISDNAGPGILLELESNAGPAVIATDLEISGNTIVRNSLKSSPPKRAGVVLAGGQDGAFGTLLLNDNTIHDNGGPGILASRLRLDVRSSGNNVHDNQDGDSRGLGLAGR